MEVAHRLYMMEGKCENIHGHSMKVHLALNGFVDDKGVLAGLQFGEVKKLFRTWIDENFDHRLLLNQEDPWTLYLYNQNEYGRPDQADVAYKLPGLMVMPADPTTENIAKWIGQWAWEEFIENPNRRLTGNLAGIYIQVDETPVNSGSWWRWRQ